LLRWLLLRPCHHSYQFLQWRRCQVQWDREPRWRHLSQAPRAHPEHQGYQEFLAPPDYQDLREPRGRQWLLRQLARRDQARRWLLSPRCLQCLPLLLAPRDLQGIHSTQDIQDSQGSRESTLFARCWGSTADHTVHHHTTARGILRTLGTHSIYT